MTATESRNVVKVDFVLNDPKNPLLVFSHFLLLCPTGSSANNLLCEFVSNEESCNGGEPISFSQFSLMVLLLPGVNH